LKSFLNFFIEGSEKIMLKIIKKTTT